jgi:menaquinone-dependent protoporphyrinogen oxidase
LRAWSEHGTIAAAQRLGVRDHHVFGGSRAADARGLARSMAQSAPPEYRDRRDWDEIREWAQGTAATLSVPVEA